MFKLKITNRLLTDRHVTSVCRHLWNGVSGVPGLGVSVVCPTPSLQEWDRHAPQEGSRGKEDEVGLGKVELPRILSPR